MSFRDVPFHAILSLLIAPLLWGGNYVIGSVLTAELPGLWMNLARWVLAFLLLVPFFGRALMRHRTTLLQHWRQLIVLGGLGVAAFNTVLYVALKYASLPLAAIATAVCPFLILAITAVLDRHLPPLRVILAASVALLGMIAAQADALQDDVAPMGIALVLLSALIWAGYTVALQRLPIAAPAEANFLAQILVGIIILAPFAVLSAPTPSLSTLSAETWLGIGYLGACASAIAFWLWQHAIQEVGASRAGIFFNLVPIFSMGLGAMFLGEALSRTEFLAVVIIFLGIALSIDGGTKRVVKSERSASFRKDHL